MILPVLQSLAVFGVALAKQSELMDDRPAHYADRTIGLLIMQTGRSACTLCRHDDRPAHYADMMIGLHIMQT